MKRKDGRELVTEHEVTGMDKIDYIPRGELEIPESVLMCKASREPSGSWGDDDPSPDNFDDWGA